MLPKVITLLVGISAYVDARSCGTGWFDVGYLCGQGEGDCDWDSDCLPGLVCDYDLWLGEDDCVAGPYTRNGQWASWGVWSTCQGSCNSVGTRSRYRQCTPPSNGGYACQANTDYQHGSCSTASCPAIHCVWDDWVVGDCSASCGTGTRTNTRVKLVEESNGGSCTGHATEVSQCQDQPCPSDCEWNDWIIGDCSRTCGGGTRTDTRTPKKSAEHGGKECDGPTSVTESCNGQECPVDCEWNNWTIGVCSATCGDGIRTNTRIQKVSAAFGGAECHGRTSISESCNVQACPVPIPRWYVDDGCNTECEIIIDGKSMCKDGISDDFIGAFKPDSFEAGVRCCDGRTCQTPGKCPGAATQSEAVEMCSKIGNGWRLCTKDQLLSEICCRQGGNCDSYPVWTSTLE